MKKVNSEFDVGLGGLDSAEVCELVGLFLLHGMERLIPQQCIGLYRDDGLGVTNLSGPDTERLRQQVVRLFAQHGLKITVEAGIKITDFLDVSLNLDNSSFRPFRKDTRPPIYVHRGSIQPSPSH